MRTARLLNGSIATFRLTFPLLEMPNVHTSTHHRNVLSIRIDLNVRKIPAFVLNQVIHAADEAKLK